MKTLKISIAALLLGFLVWAPKTSSAQTWNVNGVEFMYTQVAPDMAEALRMIDLAAEHPKTKASAKMFYFRGLTYLKIATEYPDLGADHPDALDVAHTSFNKSIENDSKNKWTEKAKGHLLNVAIGFYNIGLNSYEAAEYQAAVDAFNKALPLLKYDVNGDLKRAQLTEEEITRMIAYSALGMENNDLAITNFKSLINLGYDDPSIYVGLAQLQLIEGDTAAAMTTIASGRDMFELEKDLINMELDLYLKQGRSQELIDKLNNAIDQDPENTVYYFARAISYEELDKIEPDGGYTALAEADYDKIMELDPEYYDAFYNKGVMYVNKVSALVDEMQSKGIYSPKEVAVYTEKINANYRSAIVNFEYVFDNHGEMTDGDRMELARTMKKIYAQLSEMDKYNAMKDWIDNN
ncbi:MAG: hypothetical protein JXR19_02180 [Bacteroidia bacterium]